jgi:hypothetical protein
MLRFSAQARLWLLLAAFLPGSGDARFLLSAQASSGSQILVCESSDNTCSLPDARLSTVWTFNGIEGSVGPLTDDSRFARLTIEKLDSTSIVVKRFDKDGGKVGRIGLYTGTVSGNQISGSVEWTWPDHAGYPAKDIFAGVFRDVVSTVPGSGTTGGKSEIKDAPPSELLVCENAGACNAAWRFSGLTGTAVWFNKHPTRATLTIVRSEPDYIVIHRTDLSDSITANYAGSRRGEQYVGTVIYNTGDRPGQSTGTWTATVPQTTCMAQAGLEAEDALRIGQNALMFKRNGDALDCYIVAAKAGDAMAQAAVGLLYYQGQEAVPQDYKEAFFWLHKAADQKIYAAEKTVAEMYRAGLGTQRDSTMADIYSARADEQKHDMERRQDMEFEHAERRADRVNHLLSSFVLGASFGLFF